ncbi:hypothetical protein COOONC_20249, partial [Cooperia oncophora]
MTRFTTAEALLDFTTFKSSKMARIGAQGPLPKPPIPTLDHSLDRYIEYAEVVAEGRRQPLQRTQRAVYDFRKAGLIYQKRLLRLAESEENW